MQAKLIEQGVHMSFWNCEGMQTSPEVFIKLRVRVEEDAVILAQLVDRILPAAKDDPDTWLPVPALLLHPGIDSRMCLHDCVRPWFPPLDGLQHISQPLSIALP